MRSAAESDDDEDKAFIIHSLPAVVTDAATIHGLRRQYSMHLSCNITKRGLYRAGL